MYSGSFAARSDNSGNLLQQFTDGKRFALNLVEVLKAYRKVLIPELNMGQLRMLVRSKFLVDAIGFNKVQGKPFSVSELLQEITRIVGSGSEAS